jgi:predicted nucleic-acid-binding protein
MMIGLDTNVLLRLGDDEEPIQRDRARALVRSQGENGCFVNEIVLAEFAWTLTRTYKLSRADAAARIAVILESPEFVVTNLDEASRAVERFRQGPADFADYFLAEINASAGCATTATLDSDALKSGEPFAAVSTDRLTAPD